MGTRETEDHIAFFMNLNLDMSSPAAEHSKEKKIDPDFYFQLEIISFRFMEIPTFLDILFVGELNSSRRLDFSSGGMRWEEMRFLQSYMPFSLLMLRSIFNNRYLAKNSENESKVKFSSLHVSKIILGWLPSLEFGNSLLFIEDIKEIFFSNYWIRNGRWSRMEFRSVTVPIRYGNSEANLWSGPTANKFVTHVAFFLLFSFWCPGFRIVQGK